MSNTTPWHGVPPEEQLKAWDELGWRESVTDALVEVASSKHADPKDRLVALSVLNDGITHNIIDLPEFHDLMLCVLLEVTDGVHRRQTWWARRRAKKLAARLMGAQWMLRTSYQIFGEINHAAKQTVPARAPLDPDTSNYS